MVINYFKALKPEDQFHTEEERERQPLTENTEKLHKENEETNTVRVSKETDKCRCRHREKQL